ESIFNALRLAHAANGRGGRDIKEVAIRLAARAYDAVRAAGVDLVDAAATGDEEAIARATEGVRKALAERELAWELQTLCALAFQDSPPAYASAAEYVAARQRQKTAE